MAIAGQVIDRGTIPAYFSDEFWTAYTVWKRFKSFGLPFSPLGWAEHPDYFLRMIEAIDEELNRGEQL